MSRPRSLLPEREVKETPVLAVPLCAYMCPRSFHELVSHNRSRSSVPALSLFRRRPNPPLLTIRLLFLLFFLSPSLNTSWIYRSLLRREIIGSFSSFFLPSPSPSRYAALKFLSLFRTYSLFSRLPFLPWCPFIPTPHCDSILTEKIDSWERQQFCPRRNRWQRIVASPQDCRRQQYWIIWGMWEDSRREWNVFYVEY